MGERGNLRTLAEVSELHLSYFKMLQLKGSIIPWTSAHFHRLFEVSSNPCATASKQKMQQTVMAVMATHQ